MQPGEDFDWLAYNLTAGSGFLSSPEQRFAETSTLREWMSSHDLSTPWASLLFLRESIFPGRNVLSVGTCPWNSPDFGLDVAEVFLDTESLSMWFVTSDGFPNGGLCGYFVAEIPGLLWTERLCDLEEDVIEAIPLKSVRKGVRLVVEMVLRRREALAAGMRVRLKNLEELPPYRGELVVGRFFKKSTVVVEVDADEQVSIAST